MIQAPHLEYPGLLRVAQIMGRICWSGGPGPEVMKHTLDSYVRQCPFALPTLRLIDRWSDSLSDHEVETLVAVCDLTDQYEEVKRSMPSTLLSEDAERFLDELFNFTNR